MESTRTPNINIKQSSPVSLNRDRQRAFAKTFEKMRESPMKQMTGEVNLDKMTRMHNIGMDGQ